MIKEIAWVRPKSNKTSLELDKGRIDQDCFSRRMSAMEAPAIA